MKMNYILKECLTLVGILDTATVKSLYSLSATVLGYTKKNLFCSELTDVLVGFRRASFWFYWIKEMN